MKCIITCVQPPPPSLPSNKSRIVQEECREATTRNTSAFVQSRQAVHRLRGLLLALCANRTITVAFWALMRVSSVVLRLVNQHHTFTLCFNKPPTKAFVGTEEIRLPKKRCVFTGSNYLVCFLILQRPIAHSSTKQLFE